MSGFPVADNRLSHRAVPGSGCLSHREIAERLGISKSRVEQLEAQALRKLKKLLEARGITFADQVRP